MAGVSAKFAGLAIDKVNRNRFFCNYNPGSMGEYEKGILAKSLMGSISQFFTLSGSGSSADIEAQHIAATSNYIIIAGVDNNRANYARTLVYVNYSGNWVKDVQLTGSDEEMEPAYFRDMSSDSQNRILLIDYYYWDNPIFIYNEGGTLLYNWGYENVGYPWAITGDGTYVYIYEAEYNEKPAKILKFSISGTLLSEKLAGSIYLNPKIRWL